MKIFILLLLFVSAVSAQTITCNGGSNTAQEGQTVTCIASSPVTWSLTPGSVGTLTTIDSTHASYTAPASTIAANVVGGCPVMPNDTIYNTRIDTLPVNTSPKAQYWTSNLGPNGINFIYSWGTSLADDSAPTGVAKQYYGSNIVSNNFVFPRTPALKREDGAFRSHWDNNDHHQTTVRTTDCTFWEIYNTSLGTDTADGTCQDGSPGCNVTSAIEYPWNNYAVTGGTDAAGFPLFATTLHLSELESGTINHALRFTSCVGCIYYGTSLWPAVGFGGCGDSDTNIAGNPCSYSPPYGARFRLRICNGSTITTNCVNTSSYSGMALNLINALHNYGMFLGDIGSMQQITVNSDVSEDPAAQAALSQVSWIPMTNFEPVDESMLQWQSGSLQVTPNGLSGVSGANTYVTPTNQAIIKAVGGSTVYRSIALQPVVVGVPQHYYYVLAGSYAFQLSSWVTGTSNKAVTWRLMSGPGSITSSGVYSAPGTSTAGNLATLKVSSNADPNAYAYVYLTILPAGANPVGSIRIDSGVTWGSVASGATTDGNGNTWLPDVGYENGAFSLLGGDYPGWSSGGAATNPLLGMYQSGHGTYGGDILYTFIVPNGNYKVHILEGHQYNGWPYYMTSYPAMFDTRMDLEAQGQVALHNFNYWYSQPAGYQGYIATPAEAYIPARVTNNVLSIAVRGVFYYSDTAVWGSNCSSCESAGLDGLEVLPDATSAHWSIDTQQQTAIAPGSTLNLYQVDWYTGLSDAQWSLVSGPGSIAVGADNLGFPCAIYTAPTTQPSANSAVVIKAQSASNPAINATAVLRFSGAVSQYR
jgi:hypothetical protein